MYFESRINNINDLTNCTIKEQAKAIKELCICEAIKIGNTIWVNDEIPSGTGGKEAAVLYKFSNKIVQFESVTVGWCNELEIIKFIKEYSNIDILKNEYNIETLKPIMLNEEEAITWFACGCCGTGFKSTISRQRQFDQDAGYGICSNCENYYL